MLDFKPQNKHPMIHSKNFGEIEILNPRSTLGISICSNNKARVNKYVRDTGNKSHQLRYELSTKDWRNIFFEDFNMSCPITQLPAPFHEIHLGHFIPIHWGVGGSFVGNVFPIYGPLNISMRDYNPLDYLEWENPDFPIHPEGVDFLVDYLARCNGLTVEEYKDYVNSCYVKYRKGRY
ncbi:hypothetical protein [Paenibacillus sp. IHBB 10380]|uniref:hypothetical protein n=1 Tax=Paenibacillus sp. IHBB 10380 TaxID=1566358 RepID=UPI0005CFBC8E|nr:hypothetical protein [Paenibacillus sp. IHBB 10380]AJS59988.1 hypothetical protein UB51_17645 [Paenibacillus sp. IHBB 10380]